MSWEILGRLVGGHSLRQPSLTLANAVSYGWQATRRLSAEARLFARRSARCSLSGKARHRARNPERSKSVDRLLEVEEHSFPSERFPERGMLNDVENARRQPNQPQQHTVLTAAFFRVGERLHRGVLDVENAAEVERHHSRLFRLDQWPDLLRDTLGIKEKEPALQA